VAKLTQKIQNCLWFDTQAEEAAKFYTSIFPDSKIVQIARYGDAGPGTKGSVMTVIFSLAGQKFMGLNAGPTFKFTEAISLMVNCDDQKEIEYYWEKLKAGGGQEVECGWLKDKFGLSWQIVPAKLDELLNESNPEKTNRVMQAVMKMKKLDIAALERAAEGK
jgi:predicted 3-demethylubiquinone-9 3-methyltransferase (glyoxalase superfamily)